MKKENDILNEILSIAEEERYNLNHPYVGSEHLLLAILKENNSVGKYLKDYKVTYSSFKNELLSVIGTSTKKFSENLYTPLLRKIIKRSKTVNKDINDIYENLFISLLDEGEGIAIRILLKMNVDLDEIYVYYKEKEKLNNKEELNKVGIILNDNICMSDKVICRDKEIEKVILTLTRKKKCNPLLIGPAGVGKTAIVEELARRINKKQVPDSLKKYKIYMIEMGSLISGTKYRGEFEERLNKVIKEIINSKNIIIFIDEIHSMVGAGGADGAINASDILKPYLARGDIKCIGATTVSEFNSSILKDKALARRFDVINISEPSSLDMYKLLTKIKKEYETFHNIKITNKIIKRIVDLSDYYMKSIVNPDKSIDLLDSSCAYAKMNHKLILSEEDIIDTIFNKTNNCLIKNNEFINKVNSKLEKYFDKKTINKIVDVFKQKNNKPVSILLNNVEIKNVIKDLLESINVVNINLNLINDSLFYDKNIENTSFSTLIEKPYTLINFDNIDSANKMIVDEIIKINTEGLIIFKNNEKLFFNNAIIIASSDSNKVYETGFNKSSKTKKLSDSLINSFKLDLRNITLKHLAI
ncbi:MAG: ATP-dependent Clp protease ATP-binding subunit [Bacilli bacterium]|nr:ATP-dependent Clp protease ATP-binding subunit [Bacilli bacterium]